MDKTMMIEASPLRVPRSTKTLRDLALEKIRNAILEGHFQPAERLTERILCEQLEVSRSVVREVLRHLEAESLVETIPHQGPIVARLDPAKAEQIYEIRALLEATAAKACAQQASAAQVADLGAALDAIERAFDDGDPAAVLAAKSRFYEILFKGGGKTVAWEIVQSLNARINLMRAMTIASPNRAKDSVSELRRIRQAIANRQPDEAFAAALDHVLVAGEVARTLLASERMEARDEQT